MDLGKRDNKEPLSKYIRGKLVNMTKRAAEKSNMAREKIRQQLLLLRENKKLPSPNRNDFELDKKYPKQQSRRRSQVKMNQDTSLVDIIESIEKDNKIPKTVNVSINNTRSQFALIKSIKTDSKVYYPRHQLLNNIQTTQF